MMAAVHAIAPHPQPRAEQGESFLASLRAGLRFASRSGELMGASR
jgi:hypothetical protein